MKFVVLFVVVACAVSASAEFRKCYQCDDASGKPKKCDSLTDSDSKNCAVETQTLCYKYGEEDKRTHGCTADANFCESKKECTTCDKDDCNSSSSVLSSAILVAASAILLKMYN